MVVTLGQQYNVGEKPTVILYTFTLIAMEGQQTKQNKNLKYIIKYVNTPE